MATYAHRPESITAAQWNGQATAELDAVLQGTPFMPSRIGAYGVTNDDYLVASGGEPIPVGSWICRNADDVVFVMSAVRFNRRFVAT